MKIMFRNDPGFEIIEVSHFAGPLSRFMGRIRPEFRLDHFSGQLSRFMGRIRPEFRLDHFMGQLLRFMGQIGPTK